MQQLSGATMAKGVEDTAYYRYARFVALNEVGGDPAEFGIPVADFHAAAGRPGSSDQPQSMTGAVDPRHQARRGRPRPARRAGRDPGPVGELRRAVPRPRRPVPNRAFGYFLAQTLVGAGPIERDRMHAYAEKAMREASDGTTWTAPDEAFEAAVHAAGRPRVRRPARCARPGTTLDRRWSPRPGWSNALGQKLVQLTMPGVPDVYQGTELWEDSLVDPDNRRPVDFAARRRAAGRRWPTRAGRSTPPARPSCWVTSGRCGPGASGPSCSPATRR